MFIKYVVRKTIENQVYILCILLVVFFCQKLVKILNATASGQLPVNLIFTLLGVGFPEMIKFILPLSLLLAILITFGKLHTNNEIIVMYACGLGKDVLVKSVMIVMIITASIALFNVGWLSPHSIRYQNTVMQSIKKNPFSISFYAGQFHFFNKNNVVIFFEKFKDNKLSNIFMAHLKTKEVGPSVILAESGYIHNLRNNNHIITLNKGTNFEDTAMLSNFRITNFLNYKAYIKNKSTGIKLNPNNFDQMNILELLYNKNIESYFEISWRFTLVFSVIIMSLIVMPLSAINCHYNSTLSILSGLLLYILFFLLQNFIKSHIRHVTENELNSIIWMWIINIFYLILAILLNLSEKISVYYIRRYLFRL